MLSPHLLMGSALFSSSFLQWPQGSCLLSTVWLQSIPCQACTGLSNQQMSLYKSSIPHAQSALYARFILAMYNLFFQTMGIIIPPRPAAILVMHFKGVTESAWLSTLNSYSGMTPPKRARVSPSYYPADLLTHIIGRK